MLTLVLPGLKKVSKQFHLWVIFDEFKFTGIEDSDVADDESGAFLHASVFSFVIRIFVLSS